MIEIVAEALIIESAMRYGGTCGGWASLTMVRADRDDMSREVFDAAIRRLAEKGTATLIPEENQKTITRADQEASIRMGGEDKHLITLH